MLLLVSFSHVQPKLNKVKRYKIKYKNGYILEKCETIGVTKKLITSKATAQEKVLLFTLANPFPYITIFNLNVVFLANLSQEVTIMLKKSR